MKRKIFILIIMFVIGLAIYSNNLINNFNVLKNDNSLLADKKDDDIDLSIKSVELYYGDQKIDFVFNSLEKKYMVNLNDSLIDKLKVKAELNDNRARFFKEYYGPRNVFLDYGKNAIELVVVGQSDAVKNIYSITVVRPKGLATNSRLLSLKINDKIVKLNDELEYAVMLDKNITRTKVEAKADTEGVRAEYKNIDLSFGDNELIISLVDDNNIRLNYKIHVVRLENDNYEKFKNISIEGIDFDFDTNKYEYNIFSKNFDYRSKIDVNPSSVIKSITTSGDGIGNKTLTVKIFEDCETKKYTFNISPYKTSSTQNNSLNNNSIFYIAFFGFSIIILIFAVCYAIKKRKSLLK